MINWNDLRYFLAVHRAGSLAGAAKELKVDQTTVGRRLTALEEELGARLFDRTPDGLSLTDAGERAIESARDLDERVGSVESAVRGGDSRPEGVVRIATSENMAIAFLVELILGVREKHPAITLEIVTGPGGVNLLRREADLAIRVSPRSFPQQQNVVMRKLADFAFALYASKSYLDARPPIAFEDGLHGHDVVVYGDELGETPPGVWMTEAATGARVVLSVNSLLGAACAASSGHALALLPCFMTRRFPTLVRATEGTALSVDAWLLVHPDLACTARVRAVSDHIAAAMKKDSDLYRGVR